MSKNEQKFPARSRRNCGALSAKESFQQSENLWLGGRIVGILDDGFVLQDESARIDIRFEEKVRVGDIVEVRIEGAREVIHGEEELVFYAREFAVLVPCQDDFFIQPSDPNYRRMVIDRTHMETMKKRAQIMDGIRAFFKKEEFLEVETPSVVKLPGMEPYLDVFKTEFVSMDGVKEDQYLITSPEYAMKKLLVAGYEKVFQLCKSFRNKETDSELHNPEFTLLEWYRGFASYEEIMQDTEQLVEFLAIELCGKPHIIYKGKTIDVSTPWPRVKVKELFAEYAGIDVETFEDVEKLRAAVRLKGYTVDDQSSYEDLFFSVFMNEIEPKLGFDRPVIVSEYPASMAALAKKIDEKYAERFEVYIAGIELCNAFTELNDPGEQKIRLEEEREQRIKMGKTDYPVDQSFVGALEFGMPPSGGNALGVDRLVMLLTDTADIRDVLFFPHRDL